MKAVTAACAFAMGEDNTHVEDIMLHKCQDDADAQSRDVPDDTDDVVTIVLTPCAVCTKTHEDRMHGPFLLNAWPGPI